MFSFSSYRDFDIEHADINLRIVNERLVEENLQLQEQVKEYERWMEFIMTKFRLQNVRFIGRACFNLTSFVCVPPLADLYHTFVVCHGPN